MKKINLDIDLIKSLYVDQRISVPIIAKQLGVGYNTIYRALKNNNIPIRSIQNAKMSSDFTGRCTVCNKQIKSKSKCKSCFDKESHNRYKIKRLNKQKSYRQTEEYRKRYSQYMKQYRKDKPEVMQGIRDRYKKDNEQYIIKSRLRQRLRFALKQYSTTGKCRCSDEYGIDYYAIIKHLGPCPGLLSDYHIDHIIPLSSFNLNIQDEVKQAFAPTNHQWLTVQENLSKHDKILV